MAVIRKRNRLVSFRLSEQEYEALQNLTLTGGARSISDFARGALCEVLDGDGEILRSVGTPQSNGTTVNHTLEQLAATMGELNRVISRLSNLVETNSRRAEEQ